MMKNTITLVALAAVLAACSGASVLRKPEESRAIDFYAGLDTDTRFIASSALQTALETVPSNRSHFWSTPSGVGGSVTPLRTVRQPSGRYCRDFRETIVRPSQGQTDRKTRACRNSERKLWQPA